MTMTSALDVTADPAVLGFDAARLRHVDAFLDRYVAAGRLKGWQLAVTRHGELAHVTSSGQARRRGRRDRSPTTRSGGCYSMTKPITAVTALAAWERGDFQLTDPVSAYIPSFADLRVWRGGSLTRPATEGITEPMRVWHLFTHMSGLTYGFLNAHPVDALYRAGGFEWGTPPDLDLAGVCDRLATFPLLFQPGTEWNYGYSNDVLGRVVEVATGRPFADVVQDTVLDPLGMTDTGVVRSRDQPRSTRGAVRADARVGPRRRHGDPLRRPGCAPRWHRRQAAMGGQGLCGTTADYLRFMAMLAGRGELDGVRIVAPHSVDYMASNHLPGGQDLAQFGRPLFAETTFDGVGFGLGVSVVTDPVKSKVPYSGASSAGAARRARRSGSTRSTTSRPCS